jgi:glycosyltransferase involved in cell wall biosynthesis
MKQRNISLLHLNNSIIRNNDWMLGAQLARVKCITHERGINQYYPLLARYYARKLNAIICISNAVRDNLRAKQIDPGNLVTIYNAIDPRVVKVDQTEAEIRQQHGIGDNNRLIGVIGNIKEWKGQETAIRAMPEVLRHYPDTLCLLVGDTAEDDMYYKERLLTLMTELGVERHIIFTGYTKNVANYLNAMQLVLHTSVEPEPFGRVLIEAMSMKKPVLGTRAGAVPEIIDEGKTGYTFAAGDDQTLSNAIIELLSDPARADQMGEQGYQRLIDNFHISVNVANTQKLYREILGKL